MSIDHRLSVIEDGCKRHRSPRVSRPLCRLCAGERLRGRVWGRTGLGSRRLIGATAEECGWSSRTFPRVSQPGPTSTMITRRGSGS